VAIPECRGDPIEDDCAGASFYVILRREMTQFHLTAAILVRVGGLSAASINDRGCVRPNSAAGVIRTSWPVITAAQRLPKPKATLWMSAPQVKGLGIVSVEGRMRATRSSLVAPLQLAPEGDQIDPAPTAG
jgi:hypothetical protein